jgi:hypothetical protein
MPWDSRFFNPIWIGLLQFNKVFKGKTVHQQADFKFIDEENWRLFVFNTIVYNSALYSASELQNIIEHEKCTATKPQHRCFTREYSASCSGSTP